jgi:Zn-dependent dipeptidase, microsomal dipeptidase homolog
MKIPVRTLCVALLAGLAACSDPIDRALNKVSKGAGTDPQPTTSALFQSLFIADLHADTLATDRDIFTTDAADPAGHVDLPRLQQGNVALQAFTVFTDTPLPRPETGCVSGDDTNFAAILQAIQLRPPATWFSQAESALHQARLLHRLRDRSLVLAADDEKDGKPNDRATLLLIETAADVAELVQRRRNHEPVIGAFLGLEGGHALEGDLDNVRAFFDAGFRMIAPTHRFDNELASASEGCGEPRGLTQFGREVIAAAAQRHMVIDLAHAASPTIQEVAAMAVAGGYPVVVSHGGVFETCHPEDPNRVARNIHDEDIEAVAATGGVIGIGYWPEAVCWTETDFQSQRLDKIVEAMAHTLKVLRGNALAARMRARDPAYDPFDHIAFGSDYDGAVTVPFDAGGIGQLVAALQAYRAKDGSRPFDDLATRKIAGANVCRVLATQLPGGDAEFARTTCAPLLRGEGLALFPDPTVGVEAKEDRNKM